MKFVYKGEPNSEELSVVQPSSKKRSKEQFRRLAYPHYERLFKIAVIRLGNREDAKDATQDTYVRAYRAFTALKDPKSCQAWLSQIHFNVIRDFWRRKKNMPDIECFDESTPIQCPTEDLLQQLCNTEINPVLLDALASLPEEFRSPLLLRELGDLSYKEIATSLEMPIGTVMSRLSRARRLVKETLLNSHYLEKSANGDLILVPGQE